MYDPWKSVSLFICNSGTYRYFFKVIFSYFLTIFLDMRYNLKYVSSLQISVRGPKTNVYIFPQKQHMKAHFPKFSHVW